MLDGTIKTRSYSQPVPRTGRREAASHEARLGNTKGLKEQEPSGAFTLHLSHPLSSGLSLFLGFLCDFI